ncbi:hypothetical protein [Yersinia enterocolitica]|nr:hypothetical protein [Yersinia enterocolitica]
MGSLGFDKKQKRDRRDKFGQQDPTVFLHQMFRELSLLLHQQKSFLVPE